MNFQMQPQPNMASNFGMGGVMLNGISRNMQNDFINHINTLEPLLAEELKNSTFRGSITNMTKLEKSKQEFALLINTSLKLNERDLEVTLYVFFVKC